MSRLPIPGSDDNVWGQILNDFLNIAHNTDGTLKSASVSAAGAEQTTNKGQPSGYAPLDSTGKVPSVNLPPGSSNSLNGDSDVSLSSPTDGQVLTYNSGGSNWINQSPPVTKVAGRTGNIVLAEADVTNLTTDLAAKVTNVSAADSTITVSGTATSPTVKVNAITESQVTNLNTDLAAKLTSSNNLSDVSSVATARSNLGVAASLVPTAIQTAAYTPAVNDFAKFDISGGSVTTQTLPQAPADKSLYAAKIIKTAGSNTLVLKTQGSDVINISSGSTTYTLNLLNQSVLMQYQASGQIWNILVDDLPLSQLDSRYSLSGTTAVITDGTTDGGTITVGTTAPPSPGPRDFWVDPAASPQATDISGVIGVSAVLAAGDLIVGNGNASIERLPIGSTGQILTVGGSDPSGLEWAPATSPNVVRSLYLQSPAAVTPSATSGTYGTTQSVGLDASTTSMVPIGILWSSSGVSGETITLQGTATYQDASTASGSVTISSNTNSAFTATNLSGLWQDGKYIVSIGFHAKSTINSSAASIAITVFGIST